MAEPTDKGEDTAISISDITAEILMEQSKSHATDLIDFSVGECCDDDNKNSLDLICGHCNCKVMKSNYGTLIQKEFFLPDMTEKYLIGTKPAGDTLIDHWLVVDMFNFENVGFTKPVDDLKYLICADCEVGPIGWHKMSAPKEFYIACTRVKYGSD